MTTQATQSNNALGRRSSPSSFFAPLQTLGLNMDRQKADRQKADRQESGRQESGRQGNELRPLEGPDGRADQDEQTGQAMTSRNAGEAGRKDDLVFPAAKQRGGMYPVEGRNQNPNPEPDPERVRGAIFRLAREYQVPEDARLETTLSPVFFSSAGAGSPETPDNPAVAPVAFSEVARRVWAQAQPQPMAPQPMAPQSSESQASAVRRSGFQTSGFQTTGSHASGSQECAPQPWAPSEDALGVEEEQPVQAATLPAQDARRDSQFDSQAGLQSGSRANSLPKSGPGSRLGLLQGRAEARALAHDAGNLLSALRLYGDLLCFSGVLHERHRHYAVDLKLLSLRSENLIERLLTLADQVASNGTSSAATPLSPVRSPELVPASATANAAMPFAPGAPSFADDRQTVSPHLGGTTSGFEAEGVSGADSEDELPDAVETSSVADILMRLRGLLGTIAHGALEIDAGDQGPLAVAAPIDVVERILVNLVSNAAAAIRNGGAIRIRAGMRAGNEENAEGYGTPVVVLTVDDSGCGISESQLRSALGDDSNRTGVPASQNVAAGGLDRRPSLGLLIVRDLVASTGGRLFIHSRQGTGTRMEIHWRAAQAESLASGRAGDLWNGDVRQGDLQDGDSRNGNLRAGNLRGRDARTGELQDGDANYRDWARARPAASSSPYSQQPYFAQPSETQPETNRASAAAFSRVRPEPRKGFMPYGETDGNRKASTGESKVAFTHAAKGAVA